MASSTRSGLLRKAAVTAATTAVAFVCGWSAGGWLAGLGLAVALGTAGGIAVLTEKPGGRRSCAAWGRRHAFGGRGNPVDASGRS